ncbi:MAG TPA: iron-sulfur cluster carrier protein ApbC [Candidatus Kapabacteria bacterium]|nr:iron-sulfur cluster carrier protein ApbC [Candidatus Kapabacteria bacterium]
MGLFSKSSKPSSSGSFTDADILAVLSNVIDPDLKKDVVTLGMIKDLRIEGDNVTFTFELTTPSCPIKDQFEREVRTAAETVAGVGNVKVNMTARVSQKAGGMSSVLPGVKNTIAVASGKGGVGKSTVAANLAVALAMDGARVGLLDADIYGPSAPIMFGLVGQQPMMRKVGEKAIMEPLEADGVKIMSIGFLVEPDTAVVWRGPMASGALKQFMSECDWGELDYLIFDMPPGTGDIQLTLVQSIPLTGALIVTTPQDVALADARKGVRMFEKVHVPVLGVVENMSYFECGHCGTREEIFSHGGGVKAASDFNVPFLGELPLQTSVRVGGDTGRPIVAYEPSTPAAQSFRKIARELAAQVSIRNIAPEHQPVEIVLDVQH